MFRIKLNESKFEDSETTTLTFKFLTGDMSGKTGKFELTDCTVSSNDVDYDTATLYLDDKQYNGEFGSWGKDRLDAVDMFENIFSAYLRDDTTKIEFLDGWDKFSKIKNLAKEQSGLKVTLPQYDVEIRMYDLMLATDELLYYISDDYFLLLKTKDNSIVTDQEFFFDQALYDDAEKIQSGKLKALYTSRDFDTYIEETVFDEE